MHLAVVLAMTAFLLTPTLTFAAPPLRSVTILSGPQTQTVGNPAQFDVLVKDTSGHGLPNASVKLIVTGVNATTTDTETTNSAGRATLSYTGSNTGGDTVVAEATAGTVQKDSASWAIQWVSAVNNATLALTPQTKTIDIGTAVTLTATLTDAADQPLSDKTVQFRVTGANPKAPTDVTTDANGEATFSYTGTVSGTDNVAAFADFDGDHSQDLQEPGATATVIQLSYRLALATSGSSAAVGSHQTVTATLTDSQGNPVSGKKVYFTVTGANPTADNQATDANGIATFSYTGAHAGVDTIAAFADLNGDTNQNGIEPEATTSITWSSSTLTISPVNLATALGTTQTFTVTVKNSAGAALNGVTVRYTVTGVNLTSGNAITNSSGQATFSVTGNHAGVDTINVYADIDTDNVQDHGEPGANTTITWARANLTLAPLSVTAVVTTSQTFTATVQNTEGTPLSGVKVQFVVTGANPTTGSGTTDTNGHATFSYTGNHPGVDTVRAFADIDVDSVQDATEPGASTTVTWSPATLTLTLSSASATVGSTQTVTATLKNTAEQPLAGIKVYFSVSGANSKTATATTNASGQASMSYAGATAGTDTISAYADLDADAVQDGGDPVGSVTLNWTTSPIPPPPSPSTPKAGCTFFVVTQHNLCAGFRDYWNTFGGLAVYGYPLTEEFQQNGLTVQYFERARFEWHPGQWPERYDVMLGLLGDELTAGRSNEAAFKPTTAKSNCTYFAATGHNLCAGFQAYWNQFGGLAVYGMPISEEFQEVNPDDGKTYTVQYFERQRFEWHPGAWPSRYDVELGRLGAEELARGS